MAELILFIMVIYVTMVYGPIAAFLVELFPARIRYTSMSLPYHIGNGWFGGMLPLLATAIVAWSGNIYYGLWYPIVVALLTVVIGVPLRTRDPARQDPRRALIAIGNKRPEGRDQLPSGGSYALSVLTLPSEVSLRESRIECVAFSIATSNFSASKLSPFSDRRGIR